MGEIVRVKKTIWRDENGWRLVLNKNSSRAVHHCSTIFIDSNGEPVKSFGGPQPIYPATNKCSNCGTEAPSDLVGLFKLHNWDELSSTKEGDTN